MASADAHERCVETLYGMSACFRRLDELRHGPMRPSELHKVLSEAVPRVLDLHLKELAEDGLVAKRIFAELPPRSEYAITSLGRSLLPIIEAMIAWGEKNRALFERKFGAMG